MKPLHWIAFILVVIGAINWGLVGFFQFDLVAALFGGQTAPLSRIVYGLVGLAGLAVIITAASLYGNPRLGDYRPGTSTMHSPR